MAIDIWGMMLEYMKQDIFLLGVLCIEPKKYIIHNLKIWLSTCSLPKALLVVGILAFSFQSWISKIVVCCSRIHVSYFYLQYIVVVLVLCCFLFEVLGLVGFLLIHMTGPLFFKRDCYSTIAFMFTISLERKKTSLC